MSDRADDRDDAMTTCEWCGHTSPDADEFAIVNEEAARFGMDDPYPGSPGEVVCKYGCPDVTTLTVASKRLADLPSGTMLGGFEV